MCAVRRMSAVHLYTYFVWERKEGRDITSH